MSLLARMRCLVCGFLYRDELPSHHCQNCYSDFRYVRPLGGTPGDPAV